MGVRPAAEVFEPLPAGYQPRDVRSGVLHKAVTRHLETFLAGAGGYEDGASLGMPAHVERELRGYLKCGVLAYGFARVRCGDCGHELLVGFSCKRRGFCPSCTARRASDCAAHLADHVLPRAPVRQWVLSFPRRVRWHLARNPKLLTKVIRIFQRELAKSYKTRAAEAGVEDGQTGAVTFVQRFGSYLNLNVHFHAVVPDGVFTRSGDTEGACFHPLPRPEPGVTRDILLRTGRKVVRLLDAHFEDVEAVSSFSESVLDSLMATSVQTGRAPPGSGYSPTETDTAAHQEGFSLHCGVRIHENDRQGLEQLLGYGGRGPLAQSRLTETDDGRYAYRLRRPMPDGRGTLVLTGPELVGRLAALVPPPRANVVRYHGVFAPAAKLRPLVVPARPNTPHDDDEQKTNALLALPKVPKRQRGGPYRIDWAALLKRVFNVDVLECAKCGGRARVLAIIKDGPTAAKILEHLGLDSSVPECAPATGPPQLDLPLAA